jgi:hypothetical protein
MDIVTSPDGTSGGEEISITVGKPVTENTTTDGS